MPPVPGPGRAGADHRPHARGQSRDRDAGRRSAGHRPRAWLPSWPQLVAEVQARTAEAGQRVEEFLVASIRDWTGRAARMLARDPWMAGYDFRTAVILGDAARVREMLAHDPALATRRDGKTGWTALHAACASRWHRLDPARPAG